MTKKIFKVLGIVLVVILVLLFTVPLLFKGKITTMVKEQVNKHINATVDFSAVNVSAFRHFPKLSVAIENLSVVGKDAFSADTLLSVSSFDLSVNLWSAITGGDITIYNIDLDQPRIHAIVNKNGLPNWNIAMPSTSTETSTESKPMNMSIKGYAIKNGYVSFVNDSTHMSTEIENLNHEGKGDFSADIFTLNTNTTADAVTFIYGGVPFLSKAKASIDMALDIDTKAAIFAFKTDKIKVNDLQLSTDGNFQLINDSTYGMDINFKAPSTEFKTLLSLIPGIYQNNFAAVKTSGQAIFNGFVKGYYSPHQLPAYQFNLGVDNGFFQYPDLPEPVKNINVAVKIDNPDGVSDHTVVDISKGHIELANQPFDFKVVVKTPISNLWVDAAAKGNLDLSKVTKFMKLAAGTQLAGIVNADVAVTGFASAMQQQKLNQFDAKGTIALNNFQYASADYPTGVELKNMLLTFNPKNVTLNNLAGQYLKTNFSANGVVSNILPYMFSNKTLDGVLNVKADYLDLNQWMGVNTDTANKNKATSTPFAVPARYNLTLNAVADKVHYDKMDITALSGSLQVVDETVKMNNIKGNALDGQIAINGYYATKLDKKKPDISFTYNVVGLDIQKTFTAFNTVQKLMPVAQCLSGKLSSKFTMSGKLGDNMMPDMNSLNGSGDVLVLNGVLNNFAPVQKLAQTLNLSQLNQLTIKDVKGLFEFANGKVLVKPFNLKYSGIDMEIGGTHGFDQSLDYIINMKVPRALMGTQGNALVNNLTTQISNKGIPVKVSDVVNLQVKLGGTIKNAIIKTDLKQTANSLAQDMKQQAADFVKAKVDSTKQAVTTAVKDTLKSVKNQVVNTAKDEVTKILTGNKDSTKGDDPKKKLEDAGKNIWQKMNPFKH